MKSSNYALNVSRDSNYIQTVPDREAPRGPLVGSGPVNKQSHSQLKRSSSFSASGIQKKHKIASWRDVTLADAAKYASLSDYGFFDKVSVKSLKNFFHHLMVGTLIYNNQNLGSKVVKKSRGL